MSPFLPSSYLIVIFSWLSMSRDVTAGGEVMIEKCPEVLPVPADVSTDNLSLKCWELNSSGSCYCFLPKSGTKIDKTDQPRATTICSSVKMNPLVIESRDETEILEKHIMSQQAVLPRTFWTGGWYDASGRMFRWLKSDAQFSNYVNWNTNYPANMGSSMNGTCVMMNCAGNACKWENQNCMTAQNSLICEALMKGKNGAGRLATTTIFAQILTMLIVWLMD